MTLEDDTFLKQYNSKKTTSAQLSEDDLERILEVYEDTASDQTPLAYVDNTVVAYDQMIPSLQQLASPKIMSHAKAIYDYWKSRRQETGNKPLHPALKFETHQDSDETDPYVCFRRREARQTRKTRARDVLSADKLKRLRRELEDGRQLMVMSSDREILKRDLMNLDRLIFEQRAKLKEMKVRAGIKGDDEDFINQKVCQPSGDHRCVTRSFADISQPLKRKAPDLPAIQRPNAGHLRLSMRPDGRSMDSDLLSLADKLAEKENELRSDIELKVQTHRKWNQYHIDLTREPLSPVKEQGMELAFRPAKTQYLMTPPASASEESMDIDEENTAPAASESQNLVPFQFKAGGGKELPSRRQPAFRRRIGRGNRLWIDRRGLVSPPTSDSEEQSDRWKYDQDDDDEPPVYAMDPFDTRALRFRSTIPLSLYMFPRRPVAAETASNSHGNPGGGQSGARPALPHPPQQGQNTS
jgi:enhancer of polycomb-like protein